MATPIQSASLSLVPSSSSLVPYGRPVVTRDPKTSGNTAGGCLFGNSVTPKVLEDMSQLDGFLRENKVKLVVENKCYVFKIEQGAGNVQVSTSMYIFVNGDRRRYDIRLKVEDYFAATSDKQGYVAIKFNRVGVIIKDSLLLDLVAEGRFEGDRSDVWGVSSSTRAIEDRHTPENSSRTALLMTSEQVNSSAAAQIPSWPVQPERNEIIFSAPGMANVVNLTQEIALDPAKFSGSTVEKIRLHLPLGLYAFTVNLNGLTVQSLEIVDDPATAESARRAGISVSLVPPRFNSPTGIHTFSTTYSGGSIESYGRVRGVPYIKQSDGSYREGVKIQVISGTVDGMRFEGCKGFVTLGHGASMTGEIHGGLKV